MAEFTRQDLSGSTFNRVRLTKSRIVDSDLGELWLRGTNLDGANLDPEFWYEGSITVCGIDIVPLLDAEFDRRWPGRELRRSTDPAGLQAAWAALEPTWAATVERAAAMPPGTVDVSVDGEWSFAQTLRHLVLATDSWLRRTILGMEWSAAMHRFGQPFDGYEQGGFDMSVFATEPPTWDEVLEARADRQRQVREYLATVTDEVLAAQRPFPWDPSGDEMMPVGDCLRVIIEEEWEHLRYAVRDLDAIAADTGD